MDATRWDALRIIHHLVDNFIDKNADLQISKSNHEKPDKEIEEISERNVNPVCNLQKHLGY